MKRLWVVGFVLAFGLNALAQEKVELRYGFKKGEKFPMTMKYSLGVKLEKVPEILQGVVTEDPIDLKFEALVDMEVTDVAESGTAVLTGAWRTAKAKGHLMVNDVDFAYDSSKKEEAKPKKQDPNDDPALQGFMDIQDQLSRMVRQPLKMSVDSQGKVTVLEGSGKLGELEGPFRSLNGLMGPLPKTKVGKGDTWKDEVKLGMPGVGGNVDIKVRTQNAFESTENVGDRECAVIKSRFEVGGKGEAQPDTEAAPGLNVKMKTEGEGEGKTYFAVKEGRPAKSQSALKVKISAVVPNPGGGDDMDIKAQLKIEMSTELGSSK